MLRAIAFVLFTRFFLVLDFHIDNKSTDDRVEASNIPIRHACRTDYLLRPLE